MSMKSIQNIEIVWKATTSENYADAIGWPKTPNIHAISSEEISAFLFLCTKLG